MCGGQIPSNQVGDAVPDVEGTGMQTNMMKDWVEALFAWTECSEVCKDTAWQLSSQERETKQHVGLSQSSLLSVH